MEQKNNLGKGMSMEENNKEIKKFLDSCRMKSIDAIPENSEVIVDVPLNKLFSLSEWAKKNIEDTPEFRAYVNANNEQKLLIIVLTLIMVSVIHYLRYGVI
jgi:hypothetical protein